MQYPLFPLSHLVGNLFFHRSVVFQQTLIQAGRTRNLIDKVYHLDRFPVNFVIVGEYFRLIFGYFMFYREASHRQKRIYVQCRNALSVMILAKISPSGSAIMIISADTSHGAESVSDISPIL